MPPPSLWRSRPTGKGRNAFKTLMRADQAEQVSDLRKLAPEEERDWRWESELRSLHVWARAGDVEAHQVAAWQPHALARLRDRLVAELAPEVRAAVAARMSRQVGNARRMQERAGSQSAQGRERHGAGHAATRTVIPDWILQGGGVAPRPWPRRSRRGLVSLGAFFPARLWAAIHASAGRALATLRP